LQEDLENAATNDIDDDNRTFQILADYKDNKTNPPPNILGATWDVKEGLKQIRQRIKNIPRFTLTNICFFFKISIT